MRTRSFLLMAVLSLGACGVPSASYLPAPPACDDYSFFSGFMRDPRVSVDEIKCRKVGGDGLPQVGFYTVYKTARTTVVYWANSRPMNVAGDAPGCIATRYTEQYPGALFDPMRDCETVTLYPSPSTAARK